VVSIEEVYQLGMNKSEYYATQFEVLKSTALAQQIVTKHSDYFDGLLEENSNSVFSKAMAIFKGDAEAPPLESELLDKKILLFQKGLTVNPIRGTQLAVIEFESEDPEMAATMANELAKVYIEDNLEARLAMTQQAATWLAGRIEGLKTKLKESEERLQQYREAEDLVDMEGAITLGAKE